MGQTGLLWDVLSVLGTWDGKDSVIWALNGTDRTTLGRPECPWDMGWEGQCDLGPQLDRQDYSGTS